MKQLKVATPLGTYPNASASVDWVFVGVRIRATLNHAAPSAVKSIVSHAVAFVPLGKHLFAQAAARLSAAPAQTVRRNINNVAAIASATPESCSSASGRGAFGLLNNKQSAESLTYAILELRVFFRGIMGLHRNLSFRCQAWGVRSAARNFLLGLHSFILARMSDSGNVQRGECRNNHGADLLDVWGAAA